MAPSLPPSQFRGCRKGPAEGAQAPGLPHHDPPPPFLAQLRAAGLALTFPVSLPSCLLPLPRTLFSFSKSFSTWSQARKMGRRGVCVWMRVCVCV